MQILLTGASGFLGSHVAVELLRRRHTVVAAVRPTTNTTHLQSLGVRCLEAPLHDQSRLQSAMTGSATVVHIAARVHTAGSWREFEQTTVAGTAHVLAAAIAAGAQHFVQVSTVGVYGRPRPDGRPFVETDDYGRPDRWNYYSRAKIAAEKLVRAAQQEGRFATTILRPTWVYGPRDTTSLSRVMESLRRRQYRWIGAADNRLSLVYVTDVATAIALAVENPAARGEIFNVANDADAPTQQEFITRLCEWGKLPQPTAQLSYGLAHTAGFAGECVAHLTGFRVCPPLTRLSVLLLGGLRRYNNDKLRCVLGWQPAVTFADGIRQAVATLPLS